MPDKTCLTDAKHRPLDDSRVREVQMYFEACVRPTLYTPAKHLTIISTVISKPEAMRGVRRRQGVVLLSVIVVPASSRPAILPVGRGTTV